MAAEQAFLKDADGKGYVQEMKTSLGAHHQWETV